MPDAPGPAPDRAAAETPGQAQMQGRGLDHARKLVKSHALLLREEREFVLDRIDDARCDRAELDRQRVIVRAAEALVECVNEGHDLDDNSDHPLWNRLDALAAAVRAEGEGQ